MENKILTLEEEQELVDELLAILTKESEQTLPNNLSLQDKRWLLNNLMIVRSAGEVDNYFLTLQNKLLLSENLKRKLIQPANLEFKKSISFFNGNLCNVNADVLLVIGDKLMFGSYHLNDNNIETEVLTRGGVQINEELSNIYQNNGLVLDYRNPYIISSGNLHFKQIVKVLVPSNGMLNCYQEDEDLTNNLKKVFQFIKNKKVASIACDISCIKLNEKDLNILKNKILNIYSKTKPKAKLIIKF